jgi:hypothetical protein
MVFAQRVLSPKGLLLRFTPLIIHREPSLVEGGHTQWGQGQKFSLRGSGKGSEHESYKCTSPYLNCCFVKVSDWKLLVEKILRVKNSFASRSH